jgi:hypothetical protein
VRASPPASPPGTDERAAGLLAELTRRVGHVLADVGQLGEAMTGMAAVAARAGRPLRRADLAPLRPPVAQFLARHADLAAGAGVVLAPAALADAPRCIEWWWARPAAGPARLDVDLDPESAEFYDYTTTDWYRVPERTGRPSVAGPYVDYICTHQYTITLSVPIVSRGQFTGVAGADILAAQVERLVLPGLVRLGRPAVLVAGNGSVLASSTPEVRPGIPAARQPFCATLVPVAGPGATSPAADQPVTLPWTLFSTRSRPRRAPPRNRSALLRA